MYEIIKDTGWSWHYVLWKVNRANLYLMMADRSRFESVKQNENSEVKQLEGAEIAARIRSKQ